MTTFTAPATLEVAPPVIERARRGDQEAFAQVIRHYDPQLRALAFRLLGDRMRMDDALQETYVKAFRGLPRFRGDARLGTWLYRIAYNACLDELERDHRITRLPLAELADREDGRGEPAEALGRSSALATALAGLALEDRAVVLLVDAQGFDYRSAAEVLGVPAGTVASRLNRARAALRRSLAPPPEVVA